MNMPAANHPTSSGFSLVELAIVLVIVALLSGGLLVTLSTSREIVQVSETQKQLTGITDALLGFAAANGRLPCPASPTSNGGESFCTSDASVPACGAEVLAAPDHGRCSQPFDGFLPARTLGLTPTDTLGYAVDSWNNRIRYAVTNVRSGAAFNGPNAIFTGRDTIKTAWLTPPLPDNNEMLRVCNTAAGVTADDCANLAATVADRAVAVIYSRGPNGGAAPAAGDETENNDADRVFINHTPSSTFDDVVHWLSPNVLYNRMIMAGRIP